MCNAVLGEPQVYYIKSAYVDGYVMQTSKYIILQISFHVLYSFLRS